MAQPAQPTYLYAIPSVYAINGDVPLVLGNLNLDRGIQAGAPIDPQNLVHAKSVAICLRGMHDLESDVRITAAVAESAELRAAAVEAAHAFAMYTPINIAQALENLANQLKIGVDQMNQHFDSIDQHLDSIDQHLDAIDHCMAATT